MYRSCYTITFILKILLEGKKSDKIGMFSNLYSAEEHNQDRGLLFDETVIPMGSTAKNFPLE